MSARAAKKRRRRQPGLSTAKTRHSSKLFLLGEPRSIKKVEKALRDLEVEIVVGHDELRVSDAGTAGVVVVPSLTRGASMAWTAAAVRESRRVRPIPVFAVVPDSTPGRAVRKIYADGATAVFEWPREALLLSRLLAELLGISLIRGPARKPRVALTRALKAHLRLAPRRTEGIRVKAMYGGTAHLSGAVASLWRKKEIERLVSHVPGVKRVVSRDLWVTPSGLSDAQIARAARSVLRSTTAVNEATISVAVHNGIAALAGTVVDRRELRRALDLLANVRGIRDINNSLVVSPPAKQRDHTVARRLTALLSARFPGERVKATVFAGVAVLSGRVSHLSTRLAIESLIDQDPSIARVINKLEVA